MFMNHVKLNLFFLIAFDGFVYAIFNCCLPQRKQNIWRSVSSNIFMSWISMKSFEIDMVIL